MSKYKRLLSLLCCLLIFSVGFSLNASAAVGSSETTFLKWASTPGITVKSNNSSNHYDGTFTEGSVQTTYVHSNKAHSNVSSIWFGKQTGTSNYFLTPNVYDYYLILSVYGEASDASQFSFVPDLVSVDFVNCDGKHFHYLEDMKVTHLDNLDNIGFTASGKIPSDCNSSMISFVTFTDNGTGTIPANLRVSVYIAAFEKGTDNSEINTQILNKLDEINNQIAEQGSQIKDAIEDQYEVKEDEDLGIGELEDQIDEKMGILNFGEEVATDFIDLFDTSDLSGTDISFPAFSIDIQGIRYNIWEQFDFSFDFLDERFPFLMTTVRTVTVLVVYVALLNYLMKVKDQILRG